MERYSSVDGRAPAKGNYASVGKEPSLARKRDLGADSKLDYALDQTAGVSNESSTTAGSSMVNVEPLPV